MSEPVCAGITLCRVMAIEPGMVHLLGITTAPELALTIALEITNLVGKGNCSFNCYASRNNHCIFFRQIEYTYDLKSPKDSCYVGWSGFPPLQRGDKITISINDQILKEKYI